MASSSLVLGLLVAIVVLLPTPVEAHDRDCLQAVHAGGTSVHVNCTGSPDEADNCLLEVKVLSVNERVGCGG